MANCDKLFREFNKELNVPESKQSKLNSSKEFARQRIRDDFKNNHPDYNPTFYTQGSSIMGTMIRTKDDTCDLDDGVYFKSNPQNVSSTTLQSWIKSAVDGITDTTPTHRKKCITLDYKAGYNIDFPVLLFDKAKDDHPLLAVKNDDFILDDPKEFVDHFKSVKTAQLIRIIRYLKAWCDFKREKMPSGLVVTVLAMNDLQENTRDDVSLKFTLIEIEKTLKRQFTCIMPTTPNDDLLGDYDDARKNNFMKNLADFIVDAKKAVDEEKNQLVASRLWQKHFGKTYFPDGEDKNDPTVNPEKLNSTIGNAKPFCNVR
ncbi:MAG: hypothetical protein HYR91_15520 [Flavobacteriia bacterium]|nr:hypothetical protein [Flavobacteriia bacterium]